jgi:arylsulfatase A-like enzyme
MTWQFRWASLAALLTIAWSSSAPADDVRPNVVFLLADDLGREDCGFMGGTEIKTPRLDRLAAAGARLDAFYAQPVCTPTRAALLTGRYPMRHGLQVGVVRPWARHGLPLAERTLAEALREAGYATAIVGKWHLGHFAPEYLPTRRGFDRQYGHYNGAIDYFTHERDGGFDWHANDAVCRDDGYATTLIARAAAKFVAEHARKRPFFLYVPFNAVHAPHQAPHQAPPEYLQRYAHLKGERRKYAAMLAALDDAVGEIVDAVERAGVKGETLFVFSSDNGGPRTGVVSDNGKYRAGKGTLYEGGVRVAAFATWEGRIKPGGAVSAPLHMVDWYPTLLKLAGANVGSNPPLDGRDLWPTLTAGAPSPHDVILLNATPNGGAVRAGDWKLVLKTGADDPDDGEAVKGGRETVELFNLADDPYERSNLAPARPEKVKELKAALARFAAESTPPKSRPKPKGFKSPKVWGEPG